MKNFAILLLVLVALVGGQKIVTYIDSMNSWWPPTAIAKGIGVPGYAVNSSYNVINMAFWTTGGPVDVALVWAKAYTYVSSDNPWGNSNAAVQKAWLDRYHAAGIKVLVSAFGSTDFPTSGGVDPSSCAQQLASFVKANQLDGADIDWEDNDAMNVGKGEQWLITFTQTLRNLLPRPYIISHAPQAPYFMGKPHYPNGGYLTVDKAVGNLIDFYNVQFYNQDTSTYDTYQSLFVSANGWATNSAVSQMVANGIPPNRIVVGKPVTRGDAANTGYVEVNQLASILSQGVRSNNWRGGVMGWQYVHDPDGSWSKTLARAF